MIADGSRPLRAVGERGSSIDENSPSLCSSDSLCLQFEVSWETYWTSRFTVLCGVSWLMMLPLMSTDLDFSPSLLLLLLYESLPLWSISSSVHATLNALNISSFWVSVPVLSQKMKSTCARSSCKEKFFTWTPTNCFYSLSTICIWRSHSIKYTYMSFASSRPTAISSGMKELFSR